MKRLLFLIALAVISLSAFAQSFNTGYFLDGYYYRYRMNPAFQNERGFMALPVISQTSLTIAGNPDASSFLTVDDGDITFAYDVENPDYSSLKDMNKLGAFINTNAAAAGFWTGRFYHTIDLNMNVDVTGNLARDFLTGIGNSFDDEGTYNLSNSTFGISLYGELAYGLSARLSDRLQVGARVKFLVGGARASLKVKDFSLQYAGETWSGGGDADLYLAVGSGSVKTETVENEDGSTSEVIDLDMDNFFDEFDGPSGVGVAMDFGAVYQVLPYLTLSASLLNLGGILWKNDVIGSTSGHFTSDEVDDITDVLRLQKGADGAASTFESTGIAAYAGAEMRLPSYDRLSFGLLLNARKNMSFWSGEVRGSANWVAHKNLALSASLAGGTYGASLGGAVNYHTGGFNIFLGTDSFCFKYDKAKVGDNFSLPIPAKGNLSLVFGITVPIGHRHLDYRGIYFN